MDIQAFEKIMGARLETFFLRTRSLQLYLNFLYLQLKSYLSVLAYYFYDMYYCRSKYYIYCHFKQFKIICFIYERHCKAI